ncbi:MAG: sigma 54-interacting transcriptional regulator [Deltaproteobacteria bacterium]|nr:sigma 54-interacting transcriptional regulator [Deltaproteobacteria bacterium]
MRFQSLKSKLLLSVSALVIFSVLIVSLLIIQRYSRSLRDTMVAQSENHAHAMALAAADMVLINDLVALQRFLDMQKKTHSDISYAFIHRDGLVLAHTFKHGIPQGLMEANAISNADLFHLKRIGSTEGEHFLDIALPIFQGKAGTLRLGFSEAKYREQMTRVWLQIGLLTFAILAVAIMGALFFIKRITRPLAALAEATQKVDRGEHNVKVPVESQDEIGKLAVSFNHMITRIENYTGQLEEQAHELERSYNQTRTFCGIVQEIGALHSLKDMGAFLITRFQHIFKCGHMCLLVLNMNRNIMYTLSHREYKVLRDPETFEAATSALHGMTDVTFYEEALFTPPLIPEEFQNAVRQAIVPLYHENQPFGALVIACPGTCDCNMQEIDSAGLILSQASGVIKRAIVQEEEISDLQSRLEAHAEFGGLVGKDRKMQVLYKLIEDIAPTDATVLIQGESGTGKELAAKAVHQRSQRKDAPFIVINCSAYPDTLLESELFGHEKGAFTGAVRQKSGRFELADGGTVFLDEIGEIPPSAQIKLLRVIQTQKFERLGGEKSLSVDVRIIAATNKDLLEEVKRGHFREDLYYRLKVIPVHMPSLRDKRNDIPLLARHFLQRFAKEQGKELRDFSTEAMRLLLDFDWPGNVRELENSIEHATVLVKGNQIEVSDLPSMLQTSGLRDRVTKHFTAPTLADHERELLQDVLEECNWNKKAAAERLGISRNTLYVKLKKYQIEQPTTH